jgi:hypothetical protein
LQRRNKLVVAGAAILLVLTVLSWPSEQFGISSPFLDIFSPEVTRYLPIGFAAIAVSTVTSTILANGIPINKTATTTKIAEETYLQGLVTITGKGGISAQNDLDLEATLYVNETFLGHRVSSLLLTPLGAASPSMIPTPEGGMPQLVIDLARMNETEWTTGEPPISIVYNQEGIYYMRISIDNYSAVSSSYLAVSSEGVTVAARTNSLLVSLTWAILLFAVLELRVKEDEGCNRKSTQQ